MSLLNVFCSVMCNQGENWCLAAATPEYVFHAKVCSAMRCDAMQMSRAESCGIIVPIQCNWRFRPIYSSGHLVTCLARYVFERLVSSYLLFVNNPIETPSCQSRVQSQSFSIMHHVIIHQSPPTNAKTTKIVRMLAPALSAVVIIPV